MIDVIRNIDINIFAHKITCKKYTQHILEITDIYLIINLNTICVPTYKSSRNSTMRWTLKNLRHLEESNLDVAVLLRWNVYTQFILMLIVRSKNSNFHLSNIQATSCARKKPLVSYEILQKKNSCDKWIVTTSCLQSLRVQFCPGKAGTARVRLPEVTQFFKS